VRQRGKEPIISWKCSSTISVNPPLWIIVFNKKNYVLKSEFASSLNPNTIENLNISKDAAATALYGVRAANGIIVLTIKKTQAKEEYKPLKPYLERL